MVNDDEERKIVCQGFVMIMLEKFFKRGAYKFAGDEKKGAPR